MNCNLVTAMVNWSPEFFRPYNFIIYFGNQENGRLNEAPLAKFGLAELGWPIASNQEKFCPHPQRKIVKGQKVPKSLTKF